jgi:hypothetical protein
MSLRSYQLTITAAAQRLSSILPDPAVGGKSDESFREIHLTSDTDCFIGATSAITTSVYGLKIFAQVAGQYPIELGPYDTGPIKLSDIWVIGTSGILHILGIPF